MTERWIRHSYSNRLVQTTYLDDDTNSAVVPEFSMGIFKLYKFMWCCLTQFEEPFSSQAPLLIGRDYSHRYRRQLIDLSRHTVSFSSVR